MCIINRLAKFQCDSSHTHIALMNGRASACQVYPRKFCAQLCFGLKDELNERAIGSIQAAPSCLDVFKELLEVCEPHPHEDTENMKYLHSGKEFFDDVHGKWLEKNRRLEIRDSGL